MKKFDSFDYLYRKLYQDSAPVIPAARSYSYLQEEKTRTAVLMIHGYAGYPGELVSVAQAVAASFDVFVPRLPGMGTSGKDFINTSRHDWMGLVLNAYDLLSGEYEDVMVMGHSMGCLLSVLLARVRKIRAQVLAMPAFSIPSLDLKKIVPIALIKKDVPTKWASDPRYHLHYEDAPHDDLKLGEEYYSHLYPRQLRELALLAKEAAEAMKECTRPTLILSSKSDAVTDGLASERYRGQANVRIEYIENATHYVFYDIDPDCEKKAIDLTVDFFKANA